MVSTRLTVRAKASDPTIANERRCAMGRRYTPVSRWGFTGPHAYFPFFRLRQHPKALRAEGELSGLTELDEQ